MTATERLAALKVDLCIVATASVENVKEQNNA